MYKNSLIGSLVILLFASAYGSSSSPQVQQRIQAAYEEASNSAQQSAMQAGDFSAPKIVPPEDILSVEVLRGRFKLLERQLKPEFHKNMLASPQISLLQEANCQPEITLPAGIEVEPGRLNGTLTLFVCNDGSYGRLGIYKRVVTPTKVYDRKCQKNDRIGEKPALSRHYQTHTGRRSTILGWENANNEIVTLYLVENEKPACMKGFEGAQERAKMIAKKLLKISAGEESSRTAK
ncbi:MAG: hypothetical protein QM788_05560 [Roseateles sp.]|uniref:hypothetical protein n=1 Tax=Roseateles sp. TaxID=1971397 RepID=UPI0039EB7842